MRIINTFIIILFFLSSCSLKYQNEHQFFSPISQTNQLFKTDFRYIGGNTIGVTFINNSKKDIFIDMNKSVFKQDGKNHKIVHGDTRKLMSRGIQPPISLPSNSKVDVSLTLVVGIYRNPSIGGTYDVEEKDINKYGCWVTGILYGGWCWSYYFMDETDLKNPQEVKNIQKKTKTEFESIQNKLPYGEFIIITEDNEKVIVPIEFDKKNSVHIVKFST